MAFCTPALRHERTNSCEGMPPFAPPPRAASAPENAISNVPPASCCPGGCGGTSRSQSSSSQERRIGEPARRRWRAAESRKTRRMSSGTTGGAPSIWSMRESRASNLLSDGTLANAHQSCSRALPRCGCHALLPTEAAVVVALAVVVAGPVAVAVAETGMGEAALDVGAVRSASARLACDSARRIVHMAALTDESHPSSSSTCIDRCHAR